MRQYSLRSIQELFLEINVRRHTTKDTVREVKLMHYTFLQWNAVVRTLTFVQTVLAALTLALSRSVKISVARAKLGAICTSLAQIAVNSGGVCASSRIKANNGVYTSRHLLQLTHIKIYFPSLIACLERGRSLRFDCQHTLGGCKLRSWWAWWGVSVEKFAVA